MSEERSRQLLDGVMSVVADRGFSTVSVSELATTLHCSLASLYQIAPDKKSLVAAAITRWGERTLGEAEVRARAGEAAVERARLYFRSGADAVAGLSAAFRHDVEVVEQTRRAYQVVSDRFVTRWGELLEEAVLAGEARPVNVRFVALAMGYLARAVRDEHLLRSSGLTASEAMLAIDQIVWNGLGLGAEEPSGP